MAEINKFYSALAASLTNPQSLGQQKQAQDFFLDEHTAALPNEGNMLTLMTMRDLLKDSTDPKKQDKLAAITKIATEESKYLTTAMELLTTDPDTISEDTKKRASRRIQDKFGKTMEGATELSKLLKSQAVQADFMKEMYSLLGDFKREGGFLSGASGNAAEEE